MPVAQILNLAPFSVEVFTSTEALQQHLGQPFLGHFIHGEFVESRSGKTFDNISPVNGHRIATVASGDSSDIDRAVSAAKHAFETGPWRHMTLADRGAVLLKLADLLDQHREQFAAVETLDTGKPITETLTGDIPRSAQNCRFFAQYAASLLDDCATNSAQERHVTVRDPLGVVGLITPWNLPLYLATWKIAPALMMGNSIVLKPAEWTPYSATLFAQLTLEAGLPPGVLNIVHGFGANSAGEALTRHPDVKAISFTGETGTGKAIMAAAAGTLKKVSFELGGKGATIIFDDANLDEAIPTALRAAFRNQGQICLAGSRLFVQRAVYGRVVSEVVNAAKKWRVGDPMHPDTQMGALIGTEHFAKVQDYLVAAQRDGHVHCGGDTPSELSNGCYLTPAVVTDLPDSHPVCEEEIFGPVLPIIPFDTEDEVIQRVNASPYGLSASVWSQDVNRCHRVSTQLHVGMVWVNCWFVRDLRTPFGGQKASGLGREGGRYSLEFFSDPKTITYRYN